MADANFTIDVVDNCSEPVRRAVALLERAAKIGRGEQASSIVQRFDITIHSDSTADNSALALTMSAAFFEMLDELSMLCPAA